VEMIDRGKYDSAIVKFDEAMQYDSVSVEYPYEKAFAYYNKNDFSKAKTMLDSLLHINKINDKIYALLGNCYEAENNMDKAFEIYEQGVEKIKYSGRLYMEMGILKHDIKQTNNAVGYWEKGVEVAPDFANNYYYLASTYSQNSYNIWSLLDGEIFILLSENQKRINETSKIMYDVFNRSLFNKDEKGNESIRFTFIDIKTDIPRPTKDLPFELACQTVYREIAPAIIGKDKNKISIEKIYKINEAFTKKWFDEGLDVYFSNLLFRWHKKLIDNNYFEAYNYLIFKEGNPQEYKEWYDKHQKAFDDFMNWLLDNPVMIDKEHRLLRSNLK
jgi:tetratricopeptide (TPR) repeat protein